MHESNGVPKEALVGFEREMDRVKDRLKNEASANEAFTLQRNRTKSAARGSGTQKKNMLRGSSASQNSNVSKQESGNRGVSRANSVLLNSISEEDENVSTYGEDRFPAKSEFMRSKPGAKSGKQESQK